jgi:arylsulfatase A-like enzyme
MVDFHRFRNRIGFLATLAGKRPGRLPLAVAVLLCSLPAFVCAADESNATARPNILFIVADDLGWSDVGWHDGFSKTPHLDKLVREGIELDQHYVQPVCTPTRTALMSGRYPGRFGPHALAPSNLRAMPLGTVTLASALQSLGYYTCQTGKWHLGSRSEWGPNAFGFDHGYGTLTGAADPWTHKYRRGPYEDTWHRDGRLFDEEGNATELVAAEALRRIDEKKSPWFVYVPFHAVHTPVDAPEEFKRLYEGVKFHDDPEKHDSRLRMAAMVSQLDAKVGQFIAALERTGQRANTLVVFTSDNGGIESLKNAYVGNVGHSPLNSENDPLRGQKATLFEGGTRVCAFANWPGRLSPRKHSPPMHIVDWFPTIAALVGHEPVADLKWDGVDQWPALRGIATNDQPRTIYIAMNNGQSLRHGDWKLIASGSKQPMLFNIAADPYEKHDLAASEPQKLAVLQTLLAEQRAKDDPKLPDDLVGLPK